MSAGCDVKISWLAFSRHFVRTAFVASTSHGSPDYLASNSIAYWFEFRQTVSATQTPSCFIL